MEQARTFDFRVSSSISPAPWLIGASFVLASIILFLFNTRLGIGVLPDTTRYMRLGPMSFDAPLYTWVLDAIRALGIPFVVGAKAFALILVAANTWLIWVTLLRGSGKVLYAAIGTALIVLSPQFVGLHALAMSEALFLFTLLTIALCFLEYLKRGGLGWLLAAGVGLGLAMLARFTAAPMAIALAALLLLEPHRSLRQRIVAIAILATVSGAIFLGWAAVSELSTGQSTGRDLAFNGNADVSVWLGGFEALSAFMLPSPIPAPYRVALMLGALALILPMLVLLCRHVAAAFAEGDRPIDALIPVVWGVFVACYVPFMVLAINIEANLTFDFRYVLPLYTAIIIVSVCAAARYVSITWWQGGALVGLAALMLVSHLVRTVSHSRYYNTHGIGYSSIDWTTSPTISAVGKLPTDAVIFSNAPDALNYLTARKTNFTPLKSHPRTGREDPKYKVVDVLAKMRRSLAAGNGYIVFLDKVDWRFYMMSEAEVVAALRPTLIMRTSDGRIYGPNRRSLAGRTSRQGTS